MPVQGKNVASLQARYCRETWFAKLVTNFAEMLIAIAIVNIHNFQADYVN